MRTTFVSHSQSLQHSMPNTLTESRRENVRFLSTRNRCTEYGKGTRIFIFAYRLAYKSYRSITGLCVCCHWALSIYEIAPTNCAFSTTSVRPYENGPINRKFPINNNNNNPYKWFACVDGQSGSENMWTRVCKYPMAIAKIDSLNEFFAQ